MEFVFKWYARTLRLDIMFLKYERKVTFKYINTCICKPVAFKNGCTNRHKINMEPVVTIQVNRILR